jgi:hypothetical protein
MSRNEKIGFACLNYMVQENCGQFDVKINKKTNEEFAFMVRTVEASAKAGNKFKAYEEKVTMAKG